MHKMATIHGDSTIKPNITNPLSIVSYASRFVNRIIPVIRNAVFKSVLII